MKMKISVASGKGGTGKTFFSVNFYYTLKDEFKSAIVDLDVEEPNVNIFIKAEKLSAEISYLTIPKNIKEKCILCGKCSEYCEFNAIFVSSDKWYLFPELCKGCTACIKLCPNDALIYGKKEHGIIRWDNSGFMEGILKIREPIAVPLIENVKKKSLEIFKDYELIIYDSPPGVTCPAISSIKNSDFTILVAEPTPFGFNDFKLTYEAIKDFNIPFGVVINKDGIGTNELENFCKDKSIPILCRIPHDKAIAELYSNGKILVKEDKTYKKYFLDCFNNIKKYLEK